MAVEVPQGGGHQGSQGSGVRSEGQWRTHTQPRDIGLMRAMGAVQHPEGQTTPQFWAQLFSRSGNVQRRQQLSAFIALFKISAVFPIGSIENERRFSLMNLIHTTLRNRLLTPHLNTCMRIAASEHTWGTFDVQAAHRAWYRKAQAHGARPLYVRALNVLKGRKVWIYS